MLGLYALIFLTAFHSLRLLKLVGPGPGPWRGGGVVRAGRCPEP